MKTINALMMAVSLVGHLGFASLSNAADGIVSKEPLADSGYCHMKFPAIDWRRSSAEQPVLKSPSPGNLIDFYGPCDHDPLGKDEAQEQRTQLERFTGFRD